MHHLIDDAATAAVLLVIGLAAAVFAKGRFDVRWLLVAVVLVWINSALILRLYGAIPDLIGGAWTWEGKLLALAATLSIAALPVIGWRHAGVALRQRSGSLRSAVPVALLYCAIFVCLALVFPGDRPTGEEVGYELTMPGLEEEPFYRGLLLFAFDRAFSGRIRIGGVDWGFGAVMSCIAFGLAHALRYGGKGFSFDLMAMTLTALPSFIAAWLRYRTGSVVLPIALHNFGNSIGLLL